MPAVKTLTQNHTSEEWAEIVHQPIVEKIKLPPGISSNDLLQKEFPPIKWVVPGLIPEGLTLLAGAPKTGKSWLALNLAAALSVGGRVLGNIAIESRYVLYIALEDTERRLQGRLNTIGAFPSEKLTLVTAWRSGDEGINDLTTWKQEYPDTEIIIIDTLQRIRGMSPNGQTYEWDYLQLGKLKQVADFLSMPIVVLHHTRKMGSTDPLFMVSGTLGITAAADTSMILKRARKSRSAELFIVGRDIEDAEYALEFQDEAGWVLLGDADEYRQSSERQDILKVLRSAKEPLALKDIAASVEKSEPNVHKMLRGLMDDGYVEKTGYGRYAPREQG